MKIEFFPKKRDFEDVFPQPIPVTSSVPGWWKTQEPVFDKSKIPFNGVLKLTVKKCQAVFDSMTAGYYLLCPVDIFIDATGPKLQIQIPASYFSQYNEIIAEHTPQQVEKYPKKNYFHPEVLRIHPMWLAHTPKNYSTLFTEPMHENNTGLHAIPGIIDTDTYISDGYLSFFVEKDFKGTIKQGTPIIQIIPFKRDKWKSFISKDKNSDMTIAKQQMKVRTVFQNGYRTKFWSKKIFQ
jgi:hypothetical protein